jgi:hypothetical protein
MSRSTTPSAWRRRVQRRRSYRHRAPDHPRCWQRLQAQRQGRARARRADAVRRRCHRGAFAGAGAAGADRRADQRQAQEPPPRAGGCRRDRGALPAPPRGRTEAARRRAEPRPDRRRARAACGHRSPQLARQAKQAARYRAIGAELRGRRVCCSGCGGAMPMRRGCPARRSAHRAVRGRPRGGRRARGDGGARPRGGRPCRPCARRRRSRPLSCNGSTWSATASTPKRHGRPRR